VAGKVAGKGAVARAAILAPQFRFFMVSEQIILPASWG